MEEQLHELTAKLGSHGDREALPGRTQQGPGDRARHRQGHAWPGTPSDPMHDHKSMHLLTPLCGGCSTMLCRLDVAPRARTVSKRRPIQRCQCTPCILVPY